MDNNQIPALFWMVIITGLSSLLGLILFYCAMLLKDTRSTVQELTKTVAKSNKLLDEVDDVVITAKESVSLLKDTATEINRSVVAPVRSLGSVLHTLSGFVEGFRGK
jgi:cell division protein FtsB